MNLSHKSGFGAACVACLLLSGAVSANDTENVVEQNVGYFPTFQESGILATRDYDYQRSSGGALYGPDLDRWAATGGPWPYEYQDGGLSRSWGPG